MLYRVKSLGLWTIVFSATLTMFQLYCGGQFYWWRKPEYMEKTIDLSQIIDKHNVVSSTPRHEWDSNSQFQWR